MAFWPFGRKTKKTDKSDAKSMGPTKEKVPDTTTRDPSPATADVNAPIQGRNPSRKGGQRQKRSSSRKVPKTQPSRTGDPAATDTSSHAPDPNQSSQTSKFPIEKEALSTASSFTQKRTKARNTRGDVPSYYFQNIASQSSIQPESFSSVPPIPPIPTLRAKRSANDNTNLPRRKSSKRKTDDHAREQEIKAMSSPIPIPKRPNSEASGLFGHSRKAAGSEVSLPLPDSLHSSMSVASDMHGFKVSAIDALSPRPTIRYTENPRHAVSASNLGPSRSSTRKEKRPMIPEESLEPKKRMEELADELDTGSIRELMERDKRRRERKRKSDQEKLQRRLQRRADKQKAAELKARNEPTEESKENIEPKGSDEAIGLGIGEGTVLPNKTERRLDSSQRGPSAEEARESPESWLQDPSREHSPKIDPFSDRNAEPTSHLDEATPADEPEEPVIETAKAVRLSSASLSPPLSPTHHTRGPSYLSTLSDLASRSTPEIPERREADSLRRDSDTSGRLGGSWTSFFKRTGTRANRSSGDRGRGTPSEFSNTSRESFARQPPPRALTRNVRARSGTPVRTQSKFREDLPELPISPPDSRIQSPEVPKTMPGADQASSGIGSLVRSDQPLSEIHPALREEVALSRHQSMRATSPEGPSSAVLSQSLASVDSEGSWLSGRPAKRSSQPITNPLRGSTGSLQHLSEQHGSDRGVGAVEDEDNTQPTPGPGQGLTSGEMGSTQRKIGSAVTAEESDDETEMHEQMRISEEGTWHGAVGRHPTIIRQSDRPKSKEGLLNEFLASEESPASSPSDDFPAAEEPLGYKASNPVNPSVHRATSVDLGKGHARHMSAGSARLLELPARSSGEFKRMSSASGERSPLSSPAPDDGGEAGA
ncbi:hypothetical protein MMC20_000324 [Loxospora ochrophaea]|nr:hypothetical protein [Loxospora ochrophaea]